MATVGFRASLSGGPNPCGQFPVYYRLLVNTVQWDSSGRYETANKGWRPVQTGEAPRVITLGAQATVLAGAAAVNNPVFGLKLFKNGTDIACGMGANDAGKPGWAYAQVTAPVLASPGDIFTVSLVASCWTTGQPAIPFPSPWPPGAFSADGYGYDMCAVDSNQYHTYFWGTDDLPDPAIATLTACVADLQSRVTALEVGGC
jgi:hypothetical protein